MRKFIVELRQEIIHEHFLCFPDGWPASNRKKRQTRVTATYGRSVVTFILVTQLATENTKWPCNGIMWQFDGQSQSAKCRIDFFNIQCFLRLNYSHLTRHLRSKILIVSKLLIKWYQFYRTTAMLSGRPCEKRRRTERVFCYVIRGRANYLHLRKVGLSSNCQHVNQRNIISTCEGLLW